jgi:UDPglucose 6-dehydrogenase
MRIGVFGTGYVGLVTGACFAEMGNDVICVDIDPAKVALLKEGVSPIYEPGLDRLLTSNYQVGRLKFTTQALEAVRNSDLLFIAVGTPSDTDGTADLSYVLQVAETIGDLMDQYKVVITKSTVPVGTTFKVKEVISKRLELRGKQIPFDVVSNPEFLKEGTAIEDCLRPSRVVVGCESDKAAEQMKMLYLPFVRNGHPIYVMDIFSSEMTKYAANAFLATKISFMNELSRLCERVGADIEKVRQGIGSDPRIGFSFIYAGLGYGGSCFPKDVKALIKTAEQNEEPLEILKAASKANDIQRARYFQKLKKHFHNDLKGKKIAIWGLAFKPLTDDIREAPALELISQLIAEGATVAAYDPVAMPNAKKELSGNTSVSFGNTAYEVLEHADALCVVTEWMPFREPDFDRMLASMKTPAVFDGRNLYETKVMQERGFLYFSVGRP